VQPHKFGQPDNLSAVVGAIDPTSSDDALAKNRWPWLVSLALAMASGRTETTLV
jgi:hypothetical protein